MATLFVVLPKIFVLLYKNIADFAENAYICEVQKVKELKEYERNIHSTI